MCQRKIIGKDVLKIVPVNPGPNGCKCPTITQVRDVDEAKNQRTKYKINECCDVKTQLKTANGYVLSFRFCICNYLSGLCGKLPPTFALQAEGEESGDDDDDDSFGENNNGGFSYIP